MITIMNNSVSLDENCHDKDSLINLDSVCFDSLPLCVRVCVFVLIYNRVYVCNCIHYHRESSLALVSVFMS